MRVTNNMITGNAKTNINSNKLVMDKYNTQMTTQKKISKASENPVIAIRSLRLATNLSHIEQYVDNNIPDADSWLDVTETALTNMKTILTDVRTQCVKGATDTLTAEDRKTILQSLESLCEQVYTEGNSDYAGRTVFTGYRTSSDLTFGKDEDKMSYTITQGFNASELEEHRYYAGDVNVPMLIDDTTADCDVKVKQQDYDRLRLGYDKIEKVNGLKIGDNTYTEGTGANSYTVYESEQAWEDACIAAGKDGKSLDDQEVIFIKSTGEFVFGNEIAKSIKEEDKARPEEERIKTPFISIDYTKNKFEKGEACPEFYYDCTRTAENGKVDTFKKENQEINYTIATGVDLTVNTQASDVFDTSIRRDVVEMINIVQKATDASGKVDQIKAMMKEAKYADPTSQQKLQTYLDAAQKEADYADDNLQKTFGNYITRFDGYLTSVNKAITNVGSMQDRLELTLNRVENQQTTITELKSNNEDRDISDIIIDYYASYNAYQASLTAASKIGQQTLLNYL